MGRKTESIEKLYSFLVSKEISGDSFSFAEILAVTDWKESTLKTYINKNYFSKYIDVISNDTCYARNTKDITYEEFAESMSQVKK
ncbi:hypothetical protein [Limisalsivibrio acetivorans]|uniref:hypothetical protein n=1 Tax=Limisalsivibrio acetivorans TaxID=1304888 RepID=UPI0003B6E3A2|nr:hypothetical protein [Limisalsivibrio acetivorans]